MFLKLGFFNNKIYILCLLLIVIKALEFFEDILISIIVTRFRYIKDKVKKLMLQT